MPPPHRNGPPNRTADLEVLRRRIAALERFSGTGTARDGGIAPLHIPVIDRHLPWGGIPRGALHEIVYDTSHGETSHSSAAATGFAAVLLGRLAQDNRRAVVWCRRPARGFRPELYGAGLTRFGLLPDQLIVAQAADSQGVLWSMEECLQSKAVAAVLGEPERADARARRRLQLAAEETGVAAVLLLDDKASAAPGTAVTRWRISPAPSPLSNTSIWRVELLKCRGGGRSGDWMLEWPANDGRSDDICSDGQGNRDEPHSQPENSEPTGSFRVVSPLCHGSDQHRAG